jgi:chromosome segregation ATPase
MGEFDLDDVERALATKIHLENSNLKATLKELEGNYTALQESNNEKWAEIQALKKEVERLKLDLAEARDDEKYWQDNLVKAQDRHSAQEGAYLKVVQTLSGRN